MHIQLFVQKHLRVSAFLISLGLLALSIIVYPQAAGTIMFLGAYVVVTIPDWVSFFQAGGFATVTLPNLTTLKAYAKVTVTPKPMTNTRRKQLRRLERKRK